MFAWRIKRRWLTGMHTRFIFLEDEELKTIETSEIGRLEEEILEMPFQKYLEYEKSKQTPFCKCNNWFHCRCVD